MATDCSKYPLHPPKIVAIAKDKVVKPINPFPDTTYLPGEDIRYGQDITFGKGLGYTKPAESNRNPDGRAKNRRVEIHLFKK